MPSPRTIITPAQLDGRSRSASGSFLPIMMAAVLFSVGMLLMVGDDMRHVLAPMLAMTHVTIWCMVTLWQRDGVVPVCDVGALCVLATFIYSIVPLLNYIAGGLQFTSLGDYRLYIMQPTPEELGAFHWWHVAYLASLAIVYVYVRGKLPKAKVRSPLPDATTQFTLFAMFFLLAIYFVALWIYAGVNYYQSYEDVREAYESSRVVQLPLIVEQVSLKLKSWLFLCKLWILVVVVAQCRKETWRLALLLWMAVEVVTTLTRMGARTELVLLLLAAAILYHRFVKPLSAKFCMAVGMLILCGFFVHGALRGKLLEKSQTDSSASLASAGNEFQSLLGTGYDLRCRMEDGLDVPTQIHFSEILRLVPQQFCSFKKTSPDQWYLQLLGLHDQGIGYMFGVMGKAAVGFGVWELIVRGALLGFILAKLHRWYVLKSAGGFFATLFYVWFCTRTYYTFRATTFFFLVWIAYEVLPVFLLLYLPRILERASKGTLRPTGTLPASGQAASQ